MGLQEQSLATSGRSDTQSMGKKTTYLRILCDLGIYGTLPTDW
jgi:hypothetical protein